MPGPATAARYSGDQVGQNSENRRGDSFPTNIPDEHSRRNSRGGWAAGLAFEGAATVWRVNSVL
jgi:hypothetical protein